MTSLLKFAPLLGLLAAPVSAQSSLAPEQMLGETPYESPSCAQADFHEFDYLNGKWNMKVMIDGKWQPGGMAEQKSALGGCATLMTVSFDHWGDFYRALTGRDGFAAILISGYDAKARNWRQIWADDMGGMISNLRGRKHEDGMRFVGHAPGGDGAELQRHEWKIIGDDIREFLFEQSLDGGQNWSVIGRAQLVRRPD